MGTQSWLSSMLKEDQYYDMISDRYINEIDAKWFSLCDFTVAVNNVKKILYYKDEAQIVYSAFSSDSNIPQRIKDIRDITHIPKDEPWLFAEVTIANKYNLYYDTVNDAFLTPNIAHAIAKLLPQKRRLDETTRGLYNMNKEDDDNLVFYGNPPYPEHIITLRGWEELPAYKRKLWYIKNEDDSIRVKGNTYAYKSELKNIGGKYDSLTHDWIFQLYQLEKIKFLVKKANMSK